MNLEWSIIDLCDFPILLPKWWNLLLYFYSCFLLLFPFSFFFWTCNLNLSCSVQIFMIMWDYLVYDTKYCQFPNFILSDLSLGPKLCWICDGLELMKILIILQCKFAFHLKKTVFLVLEVIFLNDALTGFKHMACAPRRYLNMCKEKRRLTLHIDGHGMGSLEWSVAS